MSLFTAHFAVSSLILNLDGSGENVSLSEKWVEYRATLLLMEPTWRGIKEAFYAGAAAVAEDYSIQNVKTEIAAFKKGSVRRDEQL